MVRDLILERLLLSCSGDHSVMTSCENLLRPEGGDTARSTATVRRMHTLLVLRHAAAGQAAARDHDRTLTEQGRRDAATVGRALARTSTPDRALVSSARRAQDTFAEARDHGGWSADLHVLESLYHGGPHEVIEEIGTYGAGSATLLVVGHEPWCSALIELLTGARVRMAPAALASLQIGRSWDALDPQWCVLQWFATPRTLAELHQR
jgi:phosphohistidine phosphatase